MTLLRPLDQDAGYLKAGFLGSTGSGKSYTATLLAIATRRHFRLDGPIAMFDTEGGSQYLKHWVHEMTGKPLLGVRARAYVKLLEFAYECESSGVSVAIVDSIAHPWEELKESFLAEVNAKRKQKGWDPRPLEFQDWGKIKPRWAEWTGFYLTSKLHLIVCGRAADIYEKELNEETGRKELSVVGTRMQTEKNFGYEPSLLVEMTREQILEPATHFVLRATVWKDRFAVINGATCDFPIVPPSDPKRREKELGAVWAFLGGHVRRIQPGGAATIDLETKTAIEVDEAGDDAWAKERKTRTILCEEIQGEIVAAYPGQTGAEKKAKNGLVKMAFGTHSWTAVETLPSEALRTGLAKLRTALGAMARETPKQRPTPLSDALAVSGGVSQLDIVPLTELEAAWVRVQELREAAGKHPDALREIIRELFGDPKVPLAQRKPVAPHELTLLNVQTLEMALKERWG